VRYYITTHNTNMVQAYYWNGNGWSKEMTRAIRYKSPREAMLDLTQQHIPFACEIHIVRETN
jgi:hypothetical protein